MTVLQALLLGLLQGAAEFLPISSSGHLYLAEHFLGLQELPLLFDVWLHVATLLAVCLVFRAKIARLFGVLCRLIMRKQRPEDRFDAAMLGALLVATAITAAIGFTVKDIDIGPQGISLGFLCTAALLLSARFLVKPRAKPLPWPLSGAITGLMQGIAVFPGISRSGSTISAAQFAGFSREEAGEYSFILAIPAILGGLLLSLKDAPTLASQTGAGMLALAFFAAFVSGLAALLFLLKTIKKGRLHLFAFYLIPAGAAGLLFF